MADSVELKIGRSAMRMCGVEAGLRQNVLEGVEMEESATGGADAGAVAKEVANMLATDSLGDEGIKDLKVNGSSGAEIAAEGAAELVQVF